MLTGRCQGDGSLDNSTYNTALTYVPGNGANKTTGLIATYQNGSDAAYSYTYDDVGNITSITQGTVAGGRLAWDAHSGDGSCCANTEFDTTKREHRRTVPLCLYRLNCHS